MSFRAPGSAIPPIASEAESRLRAEKSDKIRRNRWFQALAVAAILAAFTVLILWCWCPKGLTRRKNRGFEVDAPSIGKVFAVGSLAGVAGFAIGWFSFDETKPASSKSTVGVANLSPF